VNQTKSTDAAPSLPSEPISGESTVIMDEDQLLRLRAESRHPPPRAEQPTLRLPRPPRAPQG